MAHKTAKVCVQNDTGKTLRSVSVLHKYSNDYKNKKDWGRVSEGKSTPPDLIVDYTTGAFTTGRDWWVVTWEYEGDNKVYFTDPKNLRGFMDWLEKVGNVAIKAALAAAAAAESAGTATAAGASAGAVVTELLFNNESTSGFKQHILRDEDAGKVTKIIINKNNKVEWKSPSGKSKTGSSYIVANSCNVDAATVSV